MLYLLKRSHDNVEKKRKINMNTHFKLYGIINCFKIFKIYLKTQNKFVTLFQQYVECVV